MAWRVMKLVFLAPLVLVGIVLFVTLGGALVMWLWNWLLPPLFGWPALSFWQALGLLALCRVLFGGFGVHGSPGSRVRRRMAERWDHMDPVKKERIRQRMRERFGAGPSAGESPGARP